MKTIQLTQNKETIVDDDIFDQLNKYSRYAALFNIFSLMSIN